MNENKMLQTLRRTTARLLSEGPEACRKFLVDAGIVDPRPQPKLVEVSITRDGFEAGWEARRRNQTYDYMNADYLKQLELHNQQLRLIAADLEEELLYARKRVERVQKQLTTAEAMLRLSDQAIADEKKAGTKTGGE